MKNLIIFSVFILLLVFTQFAQAQTVEEVINKHIDALGGRENLNKIQNVVMEGSLNYMGTDIALVLTTVHNKLNRQDINAAGMQGFDMMTEKEGWTYMPFSGMQQPEQKAADDVKENRADMDAVGPLVDYVKKGHKVELAGKETVNGKDCYKLKLTLASSKIVFLYLDSASNLIIRSTDKRKINGVVTDMQSDYDDYKEVEGVKMPHSITQQFGTVYISSIKVNQNIPESAYKHDM